MSWNEKAQRRHPRLSLARRAGAVPRPSRRPVLEEQGRRRLVDPQGRDRCRRESAQGRAARIPGGGRPGDRWRLQALDPVTISGGKVIEAWAVEHDLDASAIVSNSFEIEWPPRSGKRQAFPEVDRAAWFPAPIALQKITPGQVSLLVQLLEKLGATPPAPPPVAPKRPPARSGTAARRTAAPKRTR